MSGRETPARRRHRRPAHHRLAGRRRPGHVGGRDALPAVRLGAGGAGRPEDLEHRDGHGPGDLARGAADHRSRPRRAVQRGAADDRVGRRARRAGRERQRHELDRLCGRPGAGRRPAHARGAVRQRRAHGDLRSQSARRSRCPDLGRRAAAARRGAVRGSRLAGERQDRRQPQAFWFGGWSGDVRTAVGSVVSAAASGWAVFPRWSRTTSPSATAARSAPAGSGRPMPTARGSAPSRRGSARGARSSCSSPTRSPGWTA